MEVHNYDETVFDASVFISTFGMGYCAIVGTIETVKAIFGPAPVLDTFLAYGGLFVVSLICFIIFSMSKPVD